MSRLGVSSRRPLDVSTIPLEGLSLIEASAGTGKTYTITSLLLRQIVERGLSIDQIAAVTFTNAATAELKQRVLRRLTEALAAFDAAELGQEILDPVFSRLFALPDRKKVRQLLERAQRDVDRAAIFTIHGFAQRMLSENAFESGARYEVELSLDQSRLIDDALRDFWGGPIARLPVDEFRALGGLDLFGQLEQVAREATIALDVPLVELEPTKPLEEAMRALDAPFAAASRIFLAEGQAALALLLSGAVNGRSYRKDSVNRDAEAWRAFFEKGNPLAPLPEDKERWTQSRVSEAKNKGKEPRHAVFQALEDWRGARQLFEREQLAHRSAWFARFIEFLRERLSLEHKRSRTQSFDDLLMDLRAALRHPERGKDVAAAIRKHFPVILIDEFQDTDPVQYEIFKSIFESGAQRGGREPALYLIGDPKQSIYSFRGADIDAYLHAVTDARGGVWTLSTSYRSGPQVVAAQNALFSAPRRPFGIDSIHYEPVMSAPGREDLLSDGQGRTLPGLLIEKTQVERRSDLLELVAQRIAAFLAEGNQIAERPVTPSHLAVLTRTNREALQVQAALRRYRVPSVLHGDRSVFATQEALDLRRVLLALAEPQQKRLVRAALASRIFGFDAEGLFELEQSSELLEKWMGRIHAWSLLWQTSGILQAFEALSHESSLAERILASWDGERRMTNYRHLLELLHEAETREHRGKLGLLRFLEEGIADPDGSEVASDARQLRLESDSEAVTLTTIHKSKGLEYDVVFLPTLGLLQDKRKSVAFRFHERETGRARLEIRLAEEEREESWERALAEQREETLRLTYVALTRAKHLTLALAPTWSEKMSTRSGEFTSLGYYLYERSAPEPGGMAALWPHLKTLDPEARRREEERLSRESRGALVFSELSQAEVSPYAREEERRPLVARELPIQLPDSQKTSSFSAMTRLVVSRASREGRDIDEVDGNGSSVGLELKGAQGSRGGTPAAEERCLLADFPKGPGPGEALHGMYERALSPEGESLDRRELFKEELSKRGLSTDLADLCLQSMEDVLSTPLGEGAVQLGRLGSSDLRVEMEFSLPVGGDESKLSARRLARALGWSDVESGEESDFVGTLSPEYLQSVAELPFTAWSGFLRGFIDLVFLHDGKLYVVDYKSNFLGDNYADYGQPALEEAMRAHHYLLQAQLYALAVHRHAGQRIPGYTQETGFGGIFYLFLRGMRPDLGSTSGVYFFRPSSAELERLSRVFRDPLSFSPAASAARMNQEDV